MMGMLTRNFSLIPFIRAEKIMFPPKCFRQKDAQNYKAAWLLKKIVLFFFHTENKGILNRYMYVGLMFYCDLRILLHNTSYDRYLFSFLFGGC